MIGVEMWLGAVEAFLVLPIELSTDIFKRFFSLVVPKLDQLDWVLSQRLGLMVIAYEKPDELGLVNCSTGLSSVLLMGSEAW